MEMIFRQEIANIKSGRLPSPYILEFLCALERAVAYAHTGNGKVLSSGVMGPLYMSRALVEHGMPTIKKSIYTTPFQKATPFIIHEELWPLNRSGKAPAICSKRSQILTYGEAHYLVSVYQDVSKGWGRRRLTSFLSPSEPVRSGKEKRRS
jgi:hypothetical protein